MGLLFIRHFTRNDPIFFRKLVKGNVRIGLVYTKKVLGGVQRRFRATSQEGTHSPLKIVCRNADISEIVLCANQRQVEL